MGRLRLPLLKHYNIVSFHFDPKKSPNRIILQIPTKDFKSSDTYVLKKESAEDMAYLTSLKNGLDMLDKIEIYGHVAYFPKKEKFTILGETNVPGTADKLRTLRDEAERKHQDAARRKMSRQRKIATLRRRKSKQ